MGSPGMHTATRTFKLTREPPNPKTEEFYFNFTVSMAYGHFKSYFAINKIIFDYLQAERDVQLDSTVVQALARLLDVKPEYDWMPLNWYVNPDLPNNVINQQPSSVIVDLMGVMEHIITEGEEEAYQSEIQYRNVQSEFKRFIKSTEGWRKLGFCVLHPGNDSTCGINCHIHISLMDCGKHNFRLSSNE